MNRCTILWSALLISAVAVACAHAPSAGQEGEATVARGRYIVLTSGCNDCHTQRWAETGGKVPDADWLAGSSVGYQGPWGTTYPENLRLSVRELGEDSWIQKQLRDRHDKPPMPWVSVNAMTETDQRAIYRFISSLGPKGEDVPKDLPPGVAPQTPFIVLMPVTPKH